MLTFVILAILSVIVGVWVLNKENKPKSTPVETKEEEPVGYETGSFSFPTEPVVEKKKRVSKTTTTTAKPKVTKAKKTKKTNA